MKSFLSIAAVFLLAVTTASASVFLPYSVKTTANTRSAFSKTYANNNYNSDFSKQVKRVRRACSTNAAAMAIPGYGVTEQIFVGGFMNFLSLYNLIITARILLSWFPQAQGIGALQPVYAITDPFLNLFRGIIPPVFGLDLSPILAFVLLNVLTNATAAVGAEIPPELKKKLGKRTMSFQ